MDDFKKDEPVRGRGVSRRSFLCVGAAVGAMALANVLPFGAGAEKTGGSLPKGRVSSRRKLGTLEVSSVGLGCQDKPLEKKEAHRAREQQ